MKQNILLSYKPTFNSFFFNVNIKLYNKNTHQEANVSISYLLSYKLQYVINMNWLALL